MYTQALDATVYETNPRIRRKNFKTKNLTVQICFFFKMPVTWREREHSLVDNEVMNDPNALDALRGCNFLKFFKMPNMKANTRLFEMLIH